MKDRIILMNVAILGLLPGLLIAFGALMSLTAKKLDGVIGGDPFPTAIWLKGHGACPIFPNRIAIAVLVLSMIAYVGSLLWMTRPLHQ